MIYVIPSSFFFSNSFPFCFLYLKVSGAWGLLDRRVYSNCNLPSLPQSVIQLKQTSISSLGRRDLSRERSGTRQHQIQSISSYGRQDSSCERGGTKATSPPINFFLWPPRLELWEKQNKATSHPIKSLLWVPRLELWKRRNKGDITSERETVHMLLSAAAR